MPQPAQWNSAYGGGGLTPLRTDSVKKFWHLLSREQEKSDNNVEPRFTGINRQDNKIIALNQSFSHAAAPRLHKPLRSRSKRRRWPWQGPSQRMKMCNYLRFPSWPFTNCPNYRLNYSPSPATPAVWIRWENDTTEIETRESEPGTGLCKFAGFLKTETAIQVGELAENTCPHCGDVMLAETTSPVFWISFHYSNTEYILKRGQATGIYKQYNIRPQDKFLQSSS